MQEEIEYVINLIRKSRALPSFGFVTYELLRRVFLGEDLRKVVLEIAGKLSPSLPRQIEEYATSQQADPMTACYVNSSFPVLLIMLYKY